MRLLRLPVAAATLLALSACSMAGSTGTASGANSAPTAGTSAPASASASAPAAASKTGPIDVCDIIPLATVASVTGRSVYTTAHPITGASDSATIYACEYTDSASADDALDGFNIAVYRGGDSTTIMADLAASQTSGAVPQAGIGDRAQLGDGELDVVVGSDVVVVSDSVHEGQLAGLGLAPLEKLARQLMEKL